MLNFQLKAVFRAEKPENGQKGLLTEKIKRGILLYCVSMDEIQPAAGQGRKNAGFSVISPQKAPQSKVWNRKIIQKFTA
jgi:hypothetical protein